MVGPGRLDDQLLERRVVQVRELEELHVGDVAEEPLDRGQDADDRDREEERAARERGGGRDGDLRRALPAVQADRDGHRHADEAYREPGAEQGCPIAAARDEPGGRERRQRGVDRERHRLAGEQPRREARREREEQRGLRGEHLPHDHRAGGERDEVVQRGPRERGEALVERVRDGEADEPERERAHEEPPP